MTTNKLILAPLFAILIGLPTGPAVAQRAYLDGVLNPTAKSKAVYFVEPTGQEGDHVDAKIVGVDGVLKAEGHYTDTDLRIPDGHFTFYFPDGKVESSGDYDMGHKNGVWLRYDKGGQELAEKVYDTAPLGNIIFTLAETMPEYPGGKKAMVRYFRSKVGKTHGDVMASFVVEKDGKLSDVKVLGAEDPQLADEIAQVIDASPRWQAGMQDGQPVRVQMRVPLK